LNRPISRPLNHVISHPFLSAGLALCLVLCTAGCTVSLAPAYRIIKESHEVRFVPGQIPELRVLSIYTLENYGNGDLSSIDVILPNVKSYGLKALLIKVNGREASPVERSAEPATEEATRFRVPLDPAWNQKQRRDLVIEYAFAVPEDSGMNIALSSTSFHVISRGWIPWLQPPTHVLSPSPASPGRIAYAVQVPADFLLLVPGKPTGRARTGVEVKHLFELRESDPAPFIVAGRYVDSCSNDRGCGAAFWALEPLKGDRARAEEEIASAWNILQKNFGPLEKDNLVPHIVQSPGERHIGDDVPSAVPFFGGVMVNSPAISLGADNEDFLELVTRALAGNWFGVRIYSPNSNVGMTEGLSDYAVIVVDEARHGDSARSSRILKLLNEYDSACKGAVEKPLVDVTMRDPVEQRRIALAKAPLFFIAMEDTYGEASVRKGLAQVVSLLRGQEVGYQDIRAAIENVTNKDLAPIFRTWLYKPGIPAEFREKYQSAGAGKN
jgi:hypothetical protein